MQTVDDSKERYIPLDRKKKWKCFSFSLRLSVVFNFVEYFISDFCRGYSPIFTVFFLKIKPFHWTEMQKYVNIILTQKLVRSIEIKINDFLFLYFSILSSFYLLLFFFFFYINISSA